MFDRIYAGVMQKVRVFGVEESLWGCQGSSVCLTASIAGVM